METIRMPMVRFNANPEDRDYDYLWDITVGGPILKDKVGFTGVESQRAHGLSL